MSVRDIAEATGSPTVGLDRMLAAMARDGAITPYAAGRYGAKARNGSEPDEDDGSLEAAVLDAAGIEQGEEA